jgi:dTDP-4-amino-4,6-dideoxygalactose transaminase
LLNFKDANLAKKAKRLRWFGIDREDKQKGVWENDIYEVGYKYQMTDLSAAIGIAGLEEIDQTITYRRTLYDLYTRLLGTNPRVKIVGDNDSRKKHAAWLFTILVDQRQLLQEKLRAHGIESGQTHYRNDRYSIFKDSGRYPGMDLIDDKYLVLPLHTKMTETDVRRVCGCINSGW